MLHVTDLVNVYNVPPIRPALDSAMFPRIVELILRFLPANHQMRLRVLSRYYRLIIDVSLAHHIRLVNIDNIICPALPSFKVLDGPLPLPQSMWRSQRVRNAVRIVDNYHIRYPHWLEEPREPLQYPAFLSALPKVKVFRDLSGRLPHWVIPPSTNVWISWWGWGWGYYKKDPLEIIPGVVNNRMVILWNCSRNLRAEPSWLTRLPHSPVDIVLIFWLVGHSRMTDSHFQDLGRAIGKAAFEHISRAREKDRSATLTLVNVKTLFRSLDDAPTRQNTFQANCVAQVSQQAGLQSHEALAYLRFLSVDEYKSDIGEDRFNLQTQV